MISHKRILIVGGGGSIGSELVKQLASRNKVFIFDNNETAAFDLREELRGKGYWVHSRTGDIRNTETVYDTFSEFKPEIVIHAAALKHVTPNNEYPEDAVYINIIGTINLMREAQRQGVKRFVYISTDKVNTNSIMGITKKCAETIVRNEGGIFVAVRLGNVMNSRGSVLEIWERQAKEGEPLTITDPNCERYMMSLAQACGLILEAAKGKNGELWILPMGKRIKIGELAAKLFPFSKTKTIGLRQGEALVEELMTEEEKKHAKNRNNFLVIE